VETAPSPADGTDLARAAADRGYVFLRDLIPTSDVLALRARVLEACHVVGWLDARAPVENGVARPGATIGANDAVWTEVQCRVQPLAEFIRLREHPAILGVLQAILGGPVRGGCGDTCRVFSPRRAELVTRPHQDRFYVHGTTPLWTVWVPLGDCQRALGGLAVLPRSHLAGLWPHDDTGTGNQGVDVRAELLWASADYRCGDVLMFDGLTVHRALENRTADRLRLSADFRYTTEGR
jgi:ectoine hydroxylase-related dioxygenase (phytanoyl-CoA dioxygenase family)